MAASGRVIGVAVDKSEAAERAFKWAADTLYRKGDTIVVIHCYVAHVAAARPGIGDGLASSETMKEAQEKIDEMVQNLIHHLTISGKTGHGVKSRIVGSAGESILDLSAKENVDMLVTGSRSGKRALHSHVSDYLLRHAPFPVIIHRSTHE